MKMENRGQKIFPFADAQSPRESGRTGGGGGGDGRERGDSISGCVLLYAGAVIRNLFVAGKCIDFSPDPPLSERH